MKDYKLAYELLANAIQELKEAKELDSPGTAWAAVQDAIDCLEASKKLIE